MKCEFFHHLSVVDFTRSFQEVFNSPVSFPVLPSGYRTLSVPVYSYSPQALYRAVLSELRLQGKYSYKFLPISELVTRAMEEDIPSESILIVSSAYRTVSDSFVTPLIEACVWGADSCRKPTFVLLPKGFTPPSNWVEASSIK